MARYELSDDQWRMLAALFPKQGRGGRWLDHRTMLNGMLWILRSGAPWRDLPQRYGKWQSVHHRFNRWRRDGTFERVLKALQIRLDKQGKIDWDLWLVDGTSIRASRAAAVAFARHGASVVVTGRREDEGERTADLVRASGGKAAFVKADHSRELFAPDVRSRRMSGRGT